jgi:protein TonB
MDEKMPSDTSSTYVGWTLSFLLYLFVLFVAILMLKESTFKVEKFTASKKNLLNVTLVERQKSEPQKKKIVKKVESVAKQEIPKEEKKTIRTVANKPQPDFKNLFENIDLKDLPQEQQKQEKKIRKKIEKKEYQEVTEVKKASKIAQSLKFEKQENLIITQKDGVYDEFKGKIADILDTHWQETVDTVSGNSAEVIIGINKFGNFSYTIETLSYNDNFNSKLRDFLEQMKDIEFPPFEDGEIFHMKVVFKDILE